MKEKNSKKGLIMSEEAEVVYSLKKIYTKQQEDDIMKLEKTKTKEEVQ